MHSAKNMSCGCKKEKKACCKKNKVEIKKIQDNFFSSAACTISPDMSFTALAFNNGLNFFNADYSILNALSYSHAPPDKGISRTILFRSILV